MVFCLVVFWWCVMKLGRLCCVGMLGVLLAACAVVPTKWQAPAPMEFAPDMTTPARIALVAMGEHQAWHAPFIDKEGRLRRYGATEAEHQRLADGMLAWQRVMSYWQKSGALATLPSPQQARCVSGLDSRHNTCRYFTTDAAWSAAFVSYVMTQAKVADFHPSARHFDYIARAHHKQGAYRLQDPATTKAAVGDMLCYLRKQEHIVGHARLLHYLDNHRQWLPAHCDIVVAINDGEAWLVGGNVINTVMLRKLPVDEQGLFVLPKPLSNSASCSVADERSCNLNRQNWAALLKLYSSD